MISKQHPSWSQYESTGLQRLHNNNWSDNCVFWGVGGSLGAIDCPQSAPGSNRIPGHLWGQLARQLAKIVYMYPIIACQIIFFGKLSFPLE